MSGTQGSPEQPQPSESEIQLKKLGVVIGAIVAVIALITAVVGLFSNLIENRFIGPEPTPNLLTLASSSAGSNFSPDTVYKYAQQPEECKVEIDERGDGWVRYASAGSAERITCALEVSIPRLLVDFGTLQTNIEAKNEDSSSNASAYLTAFGYTANNINLQLDCGIKHYPEGLKAFFYIATVADPVILEPLCPEDDPSDGRCDVEFFDLGDLEIGQDYIVRLEKVSQIPGQFRCSVGPTGARYTVLAQRYLDIDEGALSRLPLDRRIEAEFSGASSAVFTFDNVMESH